MNSIDLSKYDLVAKYASPKSDIVQSEKTRSKFNILLNKQLTVFSSRLSNKKKERFYKELQILLNSGIDLQSSFELIISEESRNQDKAIYSKILNSIKNGDNLFVSMNLTGVFSSYEIQSIKVGEEAGQLNYILKELSTYFSEKIKQKRLIIQTFSYPIVVVSVSILAIAFMVNFIIPMFSDVFKRFGGDLPYLTKLVLKMSSFFSSYAIYLFLGLIVLTITILLLRKKRWFNKYWSAFLLHIPILGILIKQIYLMRFCLSMSLLLRSKLQIARTLDLVRTMIPFYSLDCALVKVKQGILEGNLLFESLDRQHFFDKRMVAMIKVGEQVNKVDEMFARLGEQYSDEIKHKTSIINSLLEPAIIIFLGLFVGLILIAMYLPLFQLSTAF